MRVLILGGTGDARALAGMMAEAPGIEVVSSLAGRTRAASTPSENTRIGGFGGPDGLERYLREERIDALIDATHPFAARISSNATIASAVTGIPRLMLIRPEWEKVTGDRWIEVESSEAAAKALPGIAQRAFLTIGRQELPAFADVKDVWFLMRMIDPPAPPIPQGQILLDRGPFSPADERRLLERYAIDMIVSKNSGGDATYPKIAAARERGIPVVMVRRPPSPAGERVGSVEEALHWLKKLGAM